MNPNEIGDILRSHLCPLLHDLLAGYQLTVEANAIVIRGVQLPEPVTTIWRNSWDFLDAIARIQSDLSQPRAVRDAIAQCTQLVIYVSYQRDKPFRVFEFASIRELWETRREKTLALIRSAGLKD